MEKAVDSKHTITELPHCVLPVTQKSTKVQHLAKQKDWNGGKKRTEKRLPSCLNQGFYIPSFEEMTLEAMELLNSLNVNPNPTPTPFRQSLLGESRTQAIRKQGGQGV
jgi:hypothetical protein